MLNYNPMQAWTTLAGYSLEEALAKMNEILPPDAYKKVGGGGGPEFTDISPAYLTKTANAVFGPCGIGWKYDIVDGSIVNTSIDKVSKNGNAYTEHTTEMLLRLNYAYADNDGNLHWSEAILANGSNANSDKGYAFRGALTNAIGSAFAKLNWQLLVYMGKLNHNNAAKLWAIWQERQAKSEKSDTQETAAEASHEPVVEPTSTGEQPETVAESAPVSEEPKAANEAQTSSTIQPRDVVIPSSVPVPLAGKTLGYVWDADTDLSKKVISFLLGIGTNMAGEKFTAKTEEEKVMLKALNIIRASGG